MSKKNISKQFAICIKNDNYPASLETRKIYEVLPDEKASQHHQIRIIDESGEDYLYPKSYFILLELPTENRELLALFS
ncbi:hypothetical protein [Sphaerospermopsis sp. LEGE 08334]|uniref:hypothetical protein n=1 Tax=Sphaerospermopsis sp. LEGE 08334 TaxID=1828651 RepID=UPI00187FD7C2|nr:hypothetical protein [Sphaerospermopsis sp. LEGE 08334]MBE9057423.1 hypothetical protein [Sphaerospermopsis sp. LEGE 08334]